MANNVAATPGTGVTFKTTDTAGVHTGHVNVDSIAAGTNAIGKLAANSGVDIGDVDVTTVPADPFGVNADAASATGSISAKLRAVATALGTTALDLGSGTGGTRTIRTIIDSSQLAAARTTAGAMSDGFQLVAFPTDGPGMKAEDAASAGGDVGMVVLARRTATPANQSGTDGDYEFLQVSGGHTWVAPPPVTKVSTNFNRPANATAYTANDAVNDNATAGGGSSTELSWSIGRSAGIIRRIRVKKSDQTVATPTIRVWLYDTVFASGAGDNEAFVHPATDAIGYVDVAVTTAGSDDAVGWTNCDIPFTGATLYGQLQTTSAFTPASGETFTVDLWYLPG